MANGDAKNFEFKIMSAWASYNSSRDKTNVAESCWVRGSQNVYKTIAGTIANRPGQKRRNAANTTLAPVKSEYTWNTSWGAVLPLWVANGKLQVEYNGSYYDLLTSVTLTRYVFDKWFNSAEAKDRVLMVHGDSTIQHWSGGIATIASVTSNTLTKSGTGSWQQAGFSTVSGEKKIMIGGIEYTYTGGESTTTLTGVTPDPTAPPVTAGTIAIQSVLTASSTPAASFSNDFIKVINNQAYVGSYTSRVCYISSNSDFKNYTVPTPRVAGSPEFLTLDAPLKGIGVRQGNAHIGIGTSTWAVITFEDITVGTTLTQKTNVSMKPMAALCAPYAHEFIDSVGDNLVFLAQDGQVRSYIDSNNSFTPRYPVLSQEVFDEIAQENPVGGQLKIIGDFTYVVFPISGKVFLYQVRETIDANGQSVGERLWHAPFIWNISRIDEISGVVHGFSNANPQAYQLWNTGQFYDDSPSDEHIPYKSVLAFAYRTSGRRQGLVSFDKLYEEGYMTLGTTLNLRVNYDYQGYTDVAEQPVNSLTRPARFYGNSIASIGDSTIGDESIGDGGISDSSDPHDAIPKFKNISPLPIVNCTEWQPIFTSELANDQWEILAIGGNVTIVEESDATFLINKLRR